MWQALSRPELRRSAVSPFRLTATIAPALVVRRWLPALLAPRGRPSISSTRQPGGVTQVSWMRWISLIWRSRWVQYGGERSKFKSCHSGYRRREIVSYSRASSPKSGTRRGVMDSARSPAKRLAHVRHSRRSTASAAGPRRRSGLCRSSPAPPSRTCARQDSGDPGNSTARLVSSSRTGENAGTLSGSRGFGGYHATSTVRQPVRRMRTRPASERWSTRCSAHMPAGKTSALCHLPRRPTIGSPRLSVACPRFEPATVSAEFKLASPSQQVRRPGPAWPVGDSSASAPENVGSRFLSLLQSAPDQTLSAIFRTAKKPNCRRHSRVRLGGSRAERYGKSLSECRFVSEAWGLADLLYKLFRLRFQEVSVVVEPESRHPLRLPVRPHETSPTS